MTSEETTLEVMTTLLEQLERAQRLLNPDESEDSEHDAQRRANITEIRRRLDILSTDPERAERCIAARIAATGAAGTSSAAASTATAADRAADQTADRAAVDSACSNPATTNKPGKETAAGGSKHTCASCGVRGFGYKCCSRCKNEGRKLTFYCSPTCQKDDWKFHKRYQCIASEASATHYIASVEGNYRIRDPAAAAEMAEIEHWMKTQQQQTIPSILMAGIVSGLYMRRQLNVPDAAAKQWWGCATSENPERAINFLIDCVRLRVEDHYCANADLVGGVGERGRPQL